MGALNGDARSALHYAAKGGPLQLVSKLISAGADVNARDVVGATPLHLASAHGNKAIVCSLVREGASVSAPNNRGQHPLRVAVKHDHVAAVDALPKAGADPDEAYRDDHPPIFLAHDSLAMTRCLLKNGADVNAVAGDYGFTVLHLVAGLGNANVVEALIGAGADVAARSYVFGSGAWRNVSGLEPRHNAAGQCNLGGMIALLRRGADVNATDENDQTPLHWLCVQEQLFRDRCGWRRRSSTAVWRKRDAHRHQRQQPPTTSQSMTGPPDACESC